MLVILGVGTFFGDRVVGGEERKMMRKTEGRRRRMGRKKDGKDIS